jgi:hypothetical protein
MQQEQYQTDNQHNVDESAGYVECEKSEQPKNNQNCGDYSKHVFISSNAILFALTPLRRADEQCRDHISDREGGHLYRCEHFRILIFTFTRSTRGK